MYCTRKKRALCLVVKIVWHVFGPTRSWHTVLLSTKVEKRYFGFFVCVRILAPVYCPFRTPLLRLVRQAVVFAPSSTDILFRQTLAYQPSSCVKSTHMKAREWATPLTVPFPGPDNDLLTVRASVPSA